MANETEMAMKSLESERRMNKLALKGAQWSIAQQLNNSMGKDMKDVLEGRKKVKLPFWKRFRHKLNLFLWHMTN
jgi:hypothetical protein